MKKAKLLINFSIYCLFGGILPFLFLAWRFELFKKVSKISIGGWGLVAVIFAFVFVTVTVNKIKDGMPYSYTKQVIDGISKVVLQLFLGAFCIYYMKDLMEELFQFFCILILCETVAVLVNPIPQWQHENNIERQESSVKKFLQTFGVIEKEEK